VLAIGNPFGLGHSLSVGVVGHRGRKLAAGVADLPRVDFVQLSMPLNPGNSGGPIFDRAGRVVGVLSGTHAQGQSIAFAVPVEALVEALDALRSGARMSRAFLGLTSRADGSSLEVVSVVPAGPADRAGIRAGDQISAFDGTQVARPSELQAVLDRLSGGTRTSARLLRDGQLQVVDVTLADWAEQPVVVGGMTLRAAPGAGGEVVAVRPRSRAERADIRVGDVVRSVNGVPVRAPADVKESLTGGTSAQLDLVRSGVPVSVQLEEAG
jgi:serine protease Do